MVRWPTTLSAVRVWTLGAASATMCSRSRGHFSPTRPSKPPSGDRISLTAVSLHVGERLECRDVVERDEPYVPVPAYVSCGCAPPWLMCHLRRGDVSSDSPCHLRRRIGHAACPQNRRPAPEPLLAGSAVEAPSGNHRVLGPCPCMRTVARAPVRLHGVRVRASRFAATFFLPGLKPKMKPALPRVNGIYRRFPVSGGWIADARLFDRAGSAITNIC